MNLRTIISACLLFTLVLIISSCRKSEDPKPAVEAPVNTVTINIATTHQEMVGFGGALTWYSPWVTNSTKKNEIADLMFDDLGIDIIRFKNWYYPDEYPVVKETTNMGDDGSLSHWDATNELYNLAMARNNNIKILLSSWGPPAALKSNNSTRETTGLNTLKKESGVFMYDEFAQYWYDVLEHVPFDPDYISIQNEPTFSTTGWTSCKWGSTQSADLPSYITAFDKVYDKIKDRTHVPIMLGPESQDIPTYSGFANLLKDKTSCGMLGYHPYNINSSMSTSAAITSLNTIGNISAKPNLMTEFSDNIGWFRTANFIQQSIIYAKSSGYIYWKLAWATPSSGENAAMISVGDGTNTYVVTPYYHLIKHFSKHIDAGYDRVEATSSNANISVTAFLNPGGTKLTVVLLNNGSTTIHVNLETTGKTINAISGTQSKVSAYYKNMTGLTPTGTVALSPESITTIVLDI